QSEMNLHFGSGHWTYFLPFLLSFRSRNCLSHFGHLFFVGSAVTTGLPSGPRFIVVGHSGAFWQVKNVPKRPSFLTMSPPQPAGHGMSVTSGPRISFPSASRLNVQGFSLSFHPVQPTNSPPLLTL